jgi:hypothetical protein
VLARSRDVVMCFVIVNARIFVLYYYYVCEAFSLVLCSLSTTTFIFIDYSSFPSAESDGRFGVAQSVDEHGERV